MQLLVDAWRRRAPRAFASCSVITVMRPLALVAVALTAMAGTASRASASVDEDWVTPLLGRLAAEEAEEKGDIVGARRARARREHRHHGAEARRANQARPATRPARGIARHASLEAEFAAPAARERPVETRHQKRGGKRLGTTLASIGRDFMLWVPQPPPSLSGVPIRWVAASDCLASALRTVLVDLAASFGQLVVNSTCRSPKHNARVGGARRSFHLTGNAVDFRVAGNARAVTAFLRARKDVGGLKHYGHGVFHIDTGPRRTW
jgi:Peptidase M15